MTKGKENRDLRIVVCDKWLIDNLFVVVEGFVTLLNLLKEKRKREKRFDNCCCDK
jgi:hypothetical protein